MSLNDFIARATSFFDKAESGALTPAKDLDAAKARVAELEAQTAKDKATIAERDGKVTELQAALEKAQGEVNAKGTEIAGLKAKIEEEKTRTDATLASLGVDAKKIPAASAEGKGGESKGGIIAQYSAITDPQQKMAFYRKNKAEIDANWGK